MFLNHFFKKAKNEKHTKKRAIDGTFAAPEKDSNR